MKFTDIDRMTKNKNENMCVLNIKEIVKKFKHEDQILHEFQKIIDYYSYNGITCAEINEKCIINPECISKYREVLNNDIEWPPLM